MGDKIQVLLVDDEIDLIDLTKRWLEKDGRIQASGVTSAQAALDTINTNHFDVIVCDYQMPMMNGIDLLKRLRSEENRTPFILFTGKGRENVVIEAINNGATFYLQKIGEPVSLYAELKHKINVAVDRTKADQALRESEERFQQVAETAGEFIWEVDTAGVLTYLSPAFEMIFGYPRDEVIGKMHFFDFLAPEARDGYMTTLMSSRGNPRGVRGIVTSNIRKDGTIITCKGSGMPFFGGDGKLLGYRGVNADITEEKRFQDQLLQSHHLLDYVISNARSAIAVHDRDLRYIYVSKQYLHDYRVTEENVIGRHHYDVFPDLPEKWRKVHQLALAGKVSSAEEDSYVREDGSIDWTRWECRPWYEQDGSVGGIIVYTEVINDRINTEDKLRRNQQLLGEAMDISNIVNWEFDAIKNVFAFDDRFFRLYGTSSEKEGATLLPAEAYAQEFVHPDDRHLVGEEIARAVNSTEEHYRGKIEHRIVRRDGAVRHIVVRYRVIRDANGKVIGTQGTNQDITEMKLNELALRRANRNLALLNSITRHDVINQTMMIEGYADILATSRLEDDQSALMGKIERSARNIRNHMDFSRLYQEVGASDPHWQDLDRTFQKVLSSLPLGDVHVVNDAQGIQVLADPLFEKVIYNLVENVMRHSGGAKNLWITAREDDDQLTIRIRDDGAGIRGDMKNLIFEAGVGSNTGFGLFLAREVLAITGFSISEMGREGEGADFAIGVPSGSWKRDP